MHLSLRKILLASSILFFLVIAGVVILYVEDSRRQNQLTEKLVLASRLQKSDHQIQTFLENRNVARKRHGTMLVGLLILGPVIYMVLAVRAHKVANRQQSNEHKFLSLLDAAPDATVIVDEQGIIKMVNLQTENLFEYSRLELVGKPVELLIPQDLRHRHTKHRDGFVNSAKVRSMGIGIELHAVKKSGMLFPVEISLSPIKTGEGMLVSASVRDISARKALEDDLKKINQELETFTYSVSHDLRAPLRGIIGFTAILEEDYASKLDDEARRITGVIKSNTLKMGNLIDDLLSFSRTGKQEIVKTNIDMNEMVNSIIAELQIPSTLINIQWEINHLLPVNADRNTLRQVWINLISNAIKYTSRCSQPVITIGSYLENAAVVYFIKDNGVGFDNQYKDKLFKVFQRLHGTDEFEGTGVGLALVEKIISRHRGKVWAEGKVNEGATFYFSLNA